MTPILKYLLPAIGVCHNFPRTLVYSLEQYMGIGVKHLHTTQEIYRIEDILSHVYQKSTTGQLYRTSLELLHIEVGMGTALHQIPPDMLTQLATDSLVKSTCQFLPLHNLVLHHDITQLPLRNNDHLLMLLFFTIIPIPVRSGSLE